jgi:hypothetical protein
MKNRRRLTPEMGMENKENQTNGISSSFVFSFRPYMSGAGDPHIRQTTHLGDLAFIMYNVNYGSFLKKKTKRFTKIYKQADEKKALK